jgi:PII-like signaling protein
VSSPPSRWAGRSAPSRGCCSSGPAPESRRYFGERDRTGDAFVADALLDLYGRRKTEVSVLLRGAAGFGAEHHLRTDRLLTLSEDLPLISVAVDTRARINALLDDVHAINRRGLITLERARMLTGAAHAVAPPEALDEATKLTVYVGRQEASTARPPTWRSATCCTAAGSRARPSCSASTGPLTASASGRASSGATPTCR